MDLVDGVRVEVSDQIATIVLDRPQTRNALTFEMVAALTALYDRLDRDDSVRAVLLTSAPGPAFCAGIDVTQLDQPAAAEAVRAMPMGGIQRNLFEVMVECGKPTVAAIDGAAVGAGCELALASDIRIMTPAAVLRLPEATVGMGANFAAQMLPRLMPRGVAFEHLYTGRPIDAPTAGRFGLANHVVDDVRGHGRELCVEIASNAPLTVRRYSQAMTLGIDLPLSTALRQRALPDPYASDDRAEGVAALRARRQPQWRGR